MKHDDLIQAYRAASQFDTSTPAPTTQDAILSYAARAAKVARIDTAAEAQNDHHWRITGTRVLGGLLLVGVVGMLAVRMFPDMQQQEGMQGRPKAQLETPAITQQDAASLAGSAIASSKAKAQAPKSQITSQSNGSTSTNDMPATETITLGKESIALGRANTTEKIEQKDSGLDANYGSVVAEAKKRAAPTVAAPAPASPVAKASTVMAFPASAPIASEQLLALINDERGACMPTPSLEAVRRLLAQGANPHYDKFPFGDHGTVLRRAQLCGFSDIINIFMQHNTK